MYLRVTCSRRKDFLEDVKSSPGYNKISQFKRDNSEHVQSYSRDVSFFWKWAKSISILLRFTGQPVPISQTVSSFGEFNVQVDAPMHLCNTIAMVASSRSTWVVVRGDIKIDQQ